MSYSHAEEMQSIMGRTRCGQCGARGEWRVLRHCFGKHWTCTCGHILDIHDWRNKSA